MDQYNPNTNEEMTVPPEPVESADVFTEVSAAAPVQRPVQPFQFEELPIEPPEPRTYAEPEESERPRRRRKKKAKKQRRGPGWFSLIAVALVFSVLGGLGGGFMSARLIDVRVNRKLQAFKESFPVFTTAGSKAEAGVTEEQEHTESAMQHLSSDLSTNVGEKELTPSEVYEAYVGSIVGIANEGTVTNYFGQVSATASSGSGFIITSDGYIVTNYHVIQNAEKLTVTLNNEEKLEATVIGYDSGNDVALIKVEAEGLTPVSIGDSDELRVGETVCAIGNPLGELTNTLTIGGVSALDREVNTDGTPINMMQTDCAINEGNSGGPLFDMNGNVIGITTAKYYGSTIEGIGFAIPINDVMRIVADLKEYGYVTGQPYMGIVVMDVDAYTAQMYRLPVGAFVDSVETGSCAETAGLQPGDIITGLGEYPVENMTELLAALKNFAAGDTTVLYAYRSGEELILPITFDEKKPAPPAKKDEVAAEQGEMPPLEEIFPGAPGNG